MKTFQKSPSSNMPKCALIIRMEWHCGRVTFVILDQVISMTIENGKEDVLEFILSDLILEKGERTQCGKMRNLFSLKIFVKSTI